MRKIVDYSIISKNNVNTIFFSIVIVVAMTGVSIYRYLDIHFWSPLEVLAELMIIFELVSRAQVKLTYELDDMVFRFTKQGLLGTQVYEVPYNNVVGVHYYVPKMISAVKFRHTYRLHSALDGRKVLTLVYYVINNGKIENRRIYFKASEKLLNGLSQRLPNKIFISEEEIVQNIILSDKS